MAELEDEESVTEVRAIVMSNNYDEDLAKKLRLLKSSGIDLKYYKLKILPTSEEEAKKVFE